ncbi:MAG: hypothetical protein IKU13_05095 [Clostridia bacterium]|nr:hypothetical protein [Clostridia bacterium]MBR5266366.1 hypothetical protein [Clostridia bacterium]
MKKGGIIALAVILVIAVIGGIMLMKFMGSPEYALMKIGKDIASQGIEGIYPHLTADGQQMLDKINEVADNKIVGALVSLFGLEDDIAIFKEKLSMMKWDVEEIMKGKNNAQVILDFEYSEEIEGTVEISMVKQGKEWKIDGIEMPQFDKD